MDKMTRLLNHVIEVTSNGYMVINVMTDELICDKNGDNCFDTFLEAKKLLDEVIA